jgi:phosphomethylpyrimidine synthase
MRISHDLQRYAEEHGVGVEDAVEIGLKEKAVEFVASGASVYHEPSA